MKFEQIEFLRKEFNKAYFNLIPRSKSNNQATVMAEDIAAIKEGLTRMAAAFDCALKVIEDDIKVKDIPSIPVQEIKATDLLVLDDKGQLKQILRPEKPKDQEAWVIPFCIEELKKLNEKLEDYSPSNPELAGLDVQKVVFRLALEMRVQNSIMAQALLALNLKKPVNIENNA